MLTAALPGTLSSWERGRVSPHPSGPAGGLDEDREVEGRRNECCEEGSERDESSVGTSALCNRQN